MTPERKAELIAEFERKNGCREGASARWRESGQCAARLRGWLHAHSDSDMAKDAERMDWAEEHCKDYGNHWQIPKPEQSSTLRAAIDSAIKDTQ